MYKNVQFSFEEVTGKGCLSAKWDLVKAREWGLGL